MNVNTANLADYVFGNITAPIASQALDFYGFIASPGEYFTGFGLSSAGGGGSAPVIDNVTLGQAGQVPVPEPTTLALLGLGMTGLALVRRRRNAAC
ncbi:MAG: PEP-CTERM sorting domain-containing protein [Candidatus Competibacteraceae bacterium]